MTDKITITRIARNTNRSQDGRTFDVIYANSQDGTSYTLYGTTPGIDLVKEGATVIVDYKQNERNGKTYRNCTCVKSVTSNEEPQQTSCSDGVEAKLDTIIDLLRQLLGGKENSTEHTETKTSDTTPSDVSTEEEPL